MRIRARLQRLEKTFPVDRGCRDRRGRHFLVDVLHSPDGILTYRPDLPETLPCVWEGLLEFLIQVMLTATDEPAVCRAGGV